MSIKGKADVCSIGVFYDGNYFLHVSNYYNYVHTKKARLSIAGLHKYIISKVAEMESRKAEHCKIVDSHYFRSRLSARSARKRGNQLFYDRAFDDILMSQGIITHYLLQNEIPGSKKNDRDLSTWLAMEAFEQTLLKQFDVLVLISADGDYQPLIRKINTQGTRCTVLSWDFEYENEEGERIVTKTSQELLQEASYHISMYEAIEDEQEQLADALFIKNVTATKVSNGEGDLYRSEVMSLKTGYGFIRHPNNNLFFHYTDLQNSEFSTVYEGDSVEFRIEKNERGDDVAKDVFLLDEDANDDRAKEDSQESFSE